MSYYSSALQPISVPSFGGRHQASDTWAWITRAQYKDYVNRFVPMENELIGMTSYKNPAVVQEAVDKGALAASNAYDTAAAQQDQTYGRYGAAISADQLRTIDRSRDLGKTAAIVDAANRIRQDLIDQDRAIAFGMSNAATSVAAQQGEGYQ